MSDSIAKVQVERVEHLSVERFQREHLAAGRPVVLAGAFSEWPALSAWTPTSLIERIGDKPVRVASSPDGVFRYDPDAENVFSVELRSFREACEEILAPSDPARRLYIMQQSIELDLPELAPDVREPALLGGERAAAHFWLGGAQNVTPLHYDAVNNLFVQVWGAKRFTIFDPGQSDRLYPFPVTARFHHISHVDVERPDLARYPRFAQAEALECELRPGDLLFLPAFFWHHVRSLDTTISVNFWWAPRFEQCMVPPCLRVLRAMYTRDRLASIGAPLTGLPGGHLAAARRALSLGHAAPAVLFAGAAVDEAVRALCRRRALEDRDGGGPRAMDELCAELVAAGVLSPAAAGTIGAWAAAAERVAAAEDDALPIAVLDSTLAELEALIDALGSEGRWTPPSSR